LRKFLSPSLHEVINSYRIENFEKICGAIWNSICSRCPKIRDLKNGTICTFRFLDSPQAFVDMSSYAIWKILGVHRLDKCRQLCRPHDCSLKSVLGASGFRPLHTTFTLNTCSFSCLSLNALQNLCLHTQFLLWNFNFKPEDCFYS